MGWRGYVCGTRWGTGEVAVSSRGRACSWSFVLATSVVVVSATAAFVSLLVAVPIHVSASASVLESIYASAPILKSVIASASMSAVSTVRSVSVVGPIVLSVIPTL